MYRQIKNVKCLELLFHRTRNSPLHVSPAASVETYKQDISTVVKSSVNLFPPSRRHSGFDVKKARCIVPSEKQLQNFLLRAILQLRPLPDESIVPNNISYHLKIPYFVRSNLQGCDRTAYKILRLRIPNTVQFHFQGNYEQSNPRYRLSNSCNLVHRGDASIPTESKATNRTKGRKRRRKMVKGRTNGPG